MSEFLDFVNRHKEAAYKIELAKGFSSANRTLLMWKAKFESAEDEIELKEIQSMTYECYMSTKNDILLHLGRKELTNRDLAEIRIYFEYKELYEKVKLSLNPKIKKEEEILTDEEKKKRSLDAFKMYFASQKIHGEDGIAAKLKKMREMYFSTSDVKKNLGILIADMEHQREIIQIVDFEAFIRSFLENPEKEFKKSGFYNPIQKAYSEKIKIHKES